jgi:hypothetical protein
VLEEHFADENWPSSSQLEGNSPKKERRMGSYIQVLDSQNLWFVEIEKGNTGREHTIKIELDEKIWWTFANCKKYANY